MKWSLVSGIVVFLASAKSIYAEPIDVCPEFANILQHKIVPELNTGLQKILVLAIDRGDRTVVSKPIRLKKDLWKNLFILDLSSRKIEARKLEDLHSEICAHLHSQISQMTLTKGDQIIVLLNPNTEAISNIMEDWSQKQVGIYKNMGLRVRWNSMNEVQKSQKTFKLKIVGEKL